MTFAPAHRSTTIYRLPRLDSKDSLAAAREIVDYPRQGGFLSSPDEILCHLRTKPLVIGLNWFQNFDYPHKHPFLKAQRKFFFIGEHELGNIRGSWHLAAVGHHRARNGKEWIRLQNCWGHDYPLVWMPFDTVRLLWETRNLEASLGG